MILSLVMLPSLTLAITASDVVCVGCIGPIDLADGGVTSAKLTNNAVTGIKISDGTILNIDINSAAAIDPKKIFGTAWTAANDGVSSGLDADYFDGLTSSQFLRSDMSSQINGTFNIVGSLGIGTTSAPVKPLTIAAGSNDAMYITSDASDDWYVGPNVVTSGFGIYDVTKSASRFHITTDGNVGIGTATPSEKLDVQGNILASGIISGSAAGLSGSTSETTLALSNTGTGGKDWLIRSTNDASGHGGGKLVFDIGGVGKTTITADGNVGIGTTSPSEKLDVQGNILASGTICNSTGACVGDTSSSSSGVSGSGTVNSLSKWTSLGGGGSSGSSSASLGNSLFNDDGSTAAVSTAAEVTSPSASSLTLGSVDTTNEGGEIRLEGAASYKYSYIDNYQGQTRIISKDTSGEHTALTIDGNGYVGIGDTTPEDLLKVSLTDSATNAINGSNWATTGNAVGIFGLTDSTSTGSGSAVGVQGLADNSGEGGDALGVFGRTLTQGGHDSSHSDATVGVYGDATATSGSNYGVWGDTYTTDHNSAGVRGVSLGKSGTADGVQGETKSGDAGAYGVYSAGSTAATGTKSAVVYTDSQGPTELYVEESAGIWFSDYGEGQLINGKAHITIDPLFAQTITVDDQHTMEVFLQPYDYVGSNQLTIQRGSNSFDVIESNNGQSNAQFAYKILAKRKYYADRRLMATPVTIDQFMRPDLTEQQRADLNNKWNIAQPVQSHSRETPIIEP